MTIKSKPIRVLLSLAGLYILIVFGIQFLAVDEVIPPEEFPESCPSASQNCVMIGTKPFRSQQLKALRFQADLSTVMDEVNRWIEEEARTTIIGQWDSQTHAVFRTLLWRFPDDFIVNGHFKNGETVLYVYSKSRLGVSDLDVNVTRVNKFVSHMNTLPSAVH